MCILNLNFVFVHQTVNKVESRYVMESSLLSTDKSSSSSNNNIVGNGNSGTMELWSAESELSIWPTARQLERKFLNVACRAVVLNESIYQRIASTNVTTASAFSSVQLQQQVHQQRSRTSSISSSDNSRSSNSGQVSASMASSHHSRDSYSAASKGKQTNKQTKKRDSIAK